MLKAIHASEDLAAAREKAIRVIEKLRGLRLSRAAELVEAAVEETLAYYTFPEEHWRRIRRKRAPMPLCDGSRRRAGKPLRQHRIVAIIVVHAAYPCAARELAL